MIYAVKAYMWFIVIWINKSEETDFESNILYFDIFSAVVCGFSRQKKQKIYNA